MLLFYMPLGERIEGHQRNMVALAIHAVCDLAAGEELTLRCAHKDRGWEHFMQSKRCSQPGIARGLATKFWPQVSPAFPSHSQNAKEDHEGPNEASCERVSP